MLREPTSTAIRDVGRKGFTTLVAAGMVGRFGPMLKVVAADGFFPKAVGRVPVVLIALSPFSQACQTIGHVEMGDVWSPADDLDPFLPLLALPAPPTLLLPSIFMTHTAACALYARLLRQYPSDPPMSDFEALDVATTQLTPHILRSELVGFLDAWESSLRVQNGPTQVCSAWPTEKLVALLSQLCATCDLPFLQ